MLLRVLNQGVLLTVNHTTTILNGFSKNSIFIKNYGLATNLYSEMAAARQGLKFHGTFSTHGGSTWPHCVWA